MRFKRYGVPDLEMIPRFDTMNKSKLQKTIEVFTPFLVKCEDITLKYITTGISAPDASLEK